MKIREITPFIGAEFTGFRYADFEQQEVLDQLVDHLHRCELVVVRSIDLTPRQQISLARRIGSPVPFLITKYRHAEFPEIMISSNEVKNNKPIGVARVGNFWHQDSSFVENPAAYTMLHGVNVPQSSGHTLFASAVDVYERLPEEWKEKVAGRTAWHTVAKRLRIREEHVGLSVAEFQALIDIEHPRVQHRVVQRDPFTEQPYLYGAPEYMHSVIGFDANENEAYFAVIDELIQDPENVYTHRWTPNDLVVWKTATTFHVATAVEPGVPRTVHRVSIEAADQWVE